MLYRERKDKNIWPWKNKRRLSHFFHSTHLRFIHKCSGIICGRTQCFLKYFQININSCQESKFYWYFIGPLFSLTFVNWRFSCKWEDFSSGFLCTGQRSNPSLESEWKRSNLILSFFKIDLWWLIIYNSIDKEGMSAFEFF